MIITLSFIRERKPTKLIKKLVQEKNHIWLNSIRSQISRKHIERLIDVTNRLTELDDRNYADSVWEIVLVQNEAIIKVREDGNMCKALSELKMYARDKEYRKRAD